MLLKLFYLRNISLGSGWSLGISENGRILCCCNWAVIICLWINESKTGEGIGKVAENCVC